MNESKLFADWKSVSGQLLELINELEKEPVDLKALQEGMVRLTRLVMMVTRALEVLGEDYGYTLKMLKEREG